VTQVPRMIPQRYEAEVPLDRLTPHPMNMNEGDQGVLSELLDANGFGGAVLAQESTGLLIDGETRWRTALAKGMKSLPVIWLDCTDDTRDRLLASLNESTRRGRNDASKVVALLTGLVKTPRGLEGTAFTGDDLDDVVRSLNPPARGNPEDKQDSWPVLAFKLPPDIRDRFYQVTDPSGDETNEGRLYWLIEQLEGTAS
jgi:hypothetical protein